MKLEGTYTFDAPRDLVWQSLLDPEILAKVMPGCQKLEKVGDNQYKGALKIKIGPVQGVIQGGITLSDLNAPESYQMKIDGKGAPGFLKGVGHVRLNEENGQTRMQYKGEANVGGRIASVGQRLLGSSAKAITRQSLESLNKQIQARFNVQTQPQTEETTQVRAETQVSEQAKVESQPAQTTDTKTDAKQNSAEKAQPTDFQQASTANASDATEIPDGPSQAEFAAGVTKEILDDLIPPEKRPMLIAVALGVLFLLVYLSNHGQHKEARIAQRVADILEERYRQYKR